MPRPLSCLALLACCCYLLAGPAAARGGSRQLLQAAPAAPSTAAPPTAAAASADTNASDCCAQLAAIGFSSNLPIVVLDTHGQKLEIKGVDVPDVRLCTCSHGLPYKDYDGLAEASVRGSTSANATKKSFAVKLQKPAKGGSQAAADGQAPAPATADGSNSSSGGSLKSNKFPLLGMPADSDWILYGGDEVDLTQGMRNWLTYNLYRAAGRYAPRTVYCEVFLLDDGAPALAASHYHGIYIALEKLKIADDRINVSKLEPPNLSGGYLISYENDNIEGGDVTVGPLKGWDHPFLMKDPKKAGPEALAWLAAYMQQFQDALEAPDWLSRAPGYSSFIDGPSWVDYFLLTELTKNPDGYRGSTYLYKDGPLAAGPPWDYNEAYGICCGYPIEGWDKQGVSGPGQSGGSAISPEGWRFNICADQARCVVDPSDGISRWYRRMWEDARFRGGTATRWAQLRAGPWSDATIAGMISDTAQQIKPAVLRNFQRYEAVLLKPWYKDAEAEWTSEVADLQGWLTKHLAWMDGALASAAAAAPAALAAGTAGR